MSSVLRVLLTGRFLRSLGFWTSVWAVAFAAFLSCWQASFLIGSFALGVGLGLGNFEIGGEGR